jgi:hypothetical protein
MKDLFCGRLEFRGRLKVRKVRHEKEGSKKIIGPA